MKTCTGCSAQLPDDAIFCPQCARRVAAESAPAGSAPGLATISGVETRFVEEPSRSAALLKHGDQVDGRYTIEREVGAGAMGVVYAAHDRVTDRQVAVKLINPALADKPASRERFLREGLMARDVRHPNVVAMYDVGDADGQIYLVMEYLGGETLRSWLHRTLRSGVDVSFETARAIITNVLDGLGAAHATGVIHRDLKPENIVLTGDPLTGDFSLKILDFGIARAVGPGTSRPATATASSTGTPLYMAPEQKTAADTVGPPADLYAITAMLYELLTGVAPEGRWRPPSQERNDIPPGVDAIVEKGLGSRPRSRFQTADEYRKALDAVCAIPTAQPEPASIPAPAPVPAPALSQQVELSRRGQLPAWLTWRSPAWELWKRMSPRARVIVAGVLVFCALGVIGNTMDSDPREPAVPQEDAEVDTIRPPAPVPPEREKPAPKPSKPALDISGRWYAAFPGTSVVAAVSEIAQRGNRMTAVTYDANGSTTGQLSGAIDGTSLAWDGRAINGMPVEGRATLTPDGDHMHVEERSPALGVLRYTAHKNHVPHW